MIKFEKEPLLYTDRFMELNLGKDRLKGLEKALRRLGHFDKKNIIIKEWEYADLDTPSYLNIVYKINDLDNTEFSFYNYGLGYGKEKDRFSQNFHLIMKKKNNNYIYTYDFYNLCNKSRNNNILDIRKITYNTKDNRIVNLVKEDYCNPKIEIQENDKKYVLSYDIKGKNSDEKVTEIMLSSFENIINYVESLNNLSLENLSKIESVLNNPENKKISKTYFVYKNNKEIARICYIEDKVDTYRIIDDTKEVNVNFNTSKITRRVERKDFDPFEEVVQKKEQIDDEIKYLMKII